MVRISPNEVGVADLAASRIIHNIKDGFSKGNWHMKLAPFLTDEIAARIFSMLDPKPHGVRRRLFSQCFSKSTILKWEELIKARVRTAVAKIHRDALAGSAEILKWWTLMANNVARELCFGEDFDALGGGEKKPPFVKDCEISMIISGISAEFKDVIPVLYPLPLPPLQRAFAVWDRLRAIGEVAIQNTSASSGKTIFSKMATSGEKVQLPEFAISQEASNMAIAGTDATAIALTYLVWAVLNRPHVKQKLQAELETCSDDPLGKEFETLPYLNDAIEETLRLYTPPSLRVCRELCQQQAGRPCADTTSRQARSSAPKPTYSTATQPSTPTP
jgi:cytochrome P450